MALLLLVAPAALAGTVNTVFSPTYGGGCLFSQPWTGKGYSGSPPTFTGPNYGAGTGGIDSFASGGIAGSHVLAWENLSMVCVNPHSYNAGGSKVHVTYNISIDATYTLTTSCGVGGTAFANANASIAIWMYGGTPTGRYGITQLTLFKASTTTCGAHLSGGPGKYTTNVLSGSANYTAPDYFAFNLELTDYANAGGYPRGSGGTADGSTSFTVNSITMTTS